MSDEHPNGDSTLVPDGRREIASRANGLVRRGLDLIGAAEAEARAAEMERLVVFGQALARSLDLESIRAVVVQHLPKLAGSDDVWVVIRTEGHWQALVGTSRDGRRDVDRAIADIADRALLGRQALEWTTGPITAEGYLCVPMIDGGYAFGVIGVPQTAGPFSEGRQRTLTAAASFLSISLRNATWFHELRELNLRDSLTGCFNREHALEVIEVELRRAGRSQLPLSLIMFGIDQFKDITDRYGHLYADAVLVAVGAKLREVLRGSDLKCRYRGEDFLLCLPETPLAAGKRVADTLQREFANMRIEWNDNEISITASFGVAAAPPSEFDTTAIIGRANAAFHQAKDRGSNRVCLDVEDTPA